MRDFETRFRRLFLASAWLFVVGAASGLWMRHGMALGLWGGLRPDYLRHGHSHLMLMGWATPALMALMAMHCVAQGHRSAASMLRSGWASWLLGLASFPAFVLWGYSSVAIGTARMPIAAILSGFAIFAWYGFALSYWRGMRGIRRDIGTRLMDVSVVALVVSSLGAWAVAGLMMAGVQDFFWQMFAVHFFVDLFGAGWLLPGVLAVIIAGKGVQRAGRAQRFVPWVMVTGAAMIFAAGLGKFGAPLGLLSMGSAGALLLSIGMLWLRRDLKTVHSRTFRAFYVLLTVMIAGAAIVPVATWALDAGLRIVYLHVLFLGVITMALAMEARRVWGAIISVRSWAIAAWVLLASMLPATGIWPAFAGASAAGYIALLGAALAFVFSVLGLLPIPVIPKNSVFVNSRLWRRHDIPSH